MVSLSPRHAAATVWADVHDDGLAATGRADRRASDAGAVPAAHAGEMLVLEAIRHRYAGVAAVDDVSLSIGGGELVALLGPSGCGKTTLLRIIAGFVAQSEGRVAIGGKPVDDLAPSRRNIGIVFQNYALFPHMSAADNIAYGLAARGVPRARRAPRVVQMLDLVKMGAFADRFPRQLSGGQQQRIAVARALAVEPRILLLDEPFAALDKNLRLDMQIEIKRIQRLSGITTILVTHDQEEALSLADRVAVLNRGKLEQFATPTEVYDRPRSLFVNTFVGSTNVLAGRIARRDGAHARVTLDLGGEIDVRLAPDDGAPGTPVAVCIRPEHLRLAEGEAAMLSGVLEMSMPLGAIVIHEVRLADGSALKVSQPRHGGVAPPAAGTPVAVQPIGPDIITAYPT